eukprot:scpid40448/ scgid0508/ 
MAFTPDQQRSLAEMISASVSSALSAHSASRGPDRGASDGPSDQAGMFLTHDSARAEMPASLDSAPAFPAFPACVCHVSNEAISKICKVEFFDLALLLPAKYERPSDDQPISKRVKLAEDGDCLVISASQASKRRIDSLASWLEAWSIFTIIATSNDPACAASLAEHQLRIVQAAAKYRLAAVLEYDIRVRQSVARARTPLSSLDTALYTECFTGQALPTCSKCRKVGHLANNFLFRGSDSRTLHATSGATSGGSVHTPGQSTICRKFNAGNCSFNQCRFKHCCSFCSGTHPAKECPARK